ncbi:MAG: hypothetical protein OIN85_01095 [Candidatus Methanoperedens sp.]|nr:hypothetical protein [Candidatus Methanoperedens sp.]
MEAKIRLDQFGSPYLVISYSERVGDEASAAEDAERLFFQKINSNGGTVHIVSGKERNSRVLLVPGYGKVPAQYAASLSASPAEATLKVTKVPTTADPSSISANDTVTDNTPPPSEL